jgi:hypothetical protein
MPCTVSCLAALAFIIAMLYFYFVTSRSHIVQQYRKNLPTRLQQLYDKIADERMKISLQGYALGFLLSLGIILYNYYQVKSKLNNVSIICITVTVTFVTNYFYYILSPKKVWMLEQMNGKEQVNAWLQMYREMQLSYHTGLALGIIAVAILAYAFRC